MKQSKFFVDPILKEIVFDKKHLWMYDLIQTKEFKRLGRISQLGSVLNIFPSATHTRLAHSLGAYEIIKRFIEHLDLSSKFPKECDHLMCAALLHDLGHGPLSHAFEKYTGLNHEVYTKLIICSPESEVNKILIKHKIDPKEVVNILNKKSKYRWATQLIDSQIDSDRMDYLMRDSRFTGAAYGQINPLIIIRGSKFIDNKICFRTKILCEIENMLI
ncbi:MAG: HD domain-containing protein, partial [Malacoplasma sp.]|nr:HD domain-containing protein [Malacoplasma sp.]MCF0227564.1 HD domain-containing protein [Malacoplasma sp.]